MSQRLNSFFDASPELRQLSGKAGQLLTLQHLYEQVSPPSLRRYSHVLKLEQRILTIAANNSAIAAKLRQLAPELVKLLQNKGCEVTGIQVRVQVSLPTSERALPHAAISTAGKKRLTELAVELPDSPLKSALQRLANQSSGRPKP